MTKSDLIDALALHLPGYKRDDVEAMVATVLKGIADTLAAGDRVEIRGFGSFSTYLRPGRIARNPKTGTVVEVPAKRVVHFNAGKELRERVLDGGKAKKPSHTAKELTAKRDLRAPVQDDHKECDRVPDYGLEVVG